MPQTATTLDTLEIDTELWYTYRNFNRNGKLWATGGRKAKGTPRVSPATEREGQMKKSKKQVRKVQAPLNHNQGPLNHSQGPLNHNQARL